MRMSEPPRQPTYHFFTPWQDADSRSCWSCTHSTGYDGAHLWCERFRLVVIGACGCWARGAGCDERDS
jgi:hypothetical protein